MSLSNTSTTTPNSPSPRSLSCTEFPLNIELIGISQHQDVNWKNAATSNRLVEIAVAQALAGLGQELLMAIYSATFQPGVKCNVPDCIFGGLLAPRCHCE